MRVDLGLRFLNWNGVGAFGSKAGGMKIFSVETYHQHTHHNKHISSYGKAPLSRIVQQPSSKVRSCAHTPG